LHYGFASFTRALEWDSTCCAAGGGGLHNLVAAEKLEMHDIPAYIPEYGPQNIMVTSEALSCDGASYCSKILL
jgi:hypothetical protein